MDNHIKWNRPGAPSTRIFIIGLLVAALGLAGCGFRRGSSFPGDVRIPWPDQETTVMEVFHNDRPVSTSTLTVQKDGEEWLLTVVAEADGIREQTIVRAHGETLTPTETELRFEAEDDAVTLQGVYDDQRVTVTVGENGDSSSFFIELPDPPYFDNEQVQFVLRALPLEEDWQGGLNLVVIRNGIHAVVGAWVVDREEVETSLGSIDAWKIEMRGLGQYAWVEVEPPHRLVKYVNEGANTVTLLKDYSEEVSLEDAQESDDVSDQPEASEEAGDDAGDAAGAQEPAS